MEIVNLRKRARKNCDSESDTHLQKRTKTLARKAKKQSCFKTRLLAVYDNASVRNKPLCNEKRRQLFSN